MAAITIRQFAGDFRMWRMGPAGALIPVIPEPTDPHGNQPIETNAATFSYEAGDETTINSKRRGGRYMQPIHMQTQPGSTSLSLTLLEVPAPILARILYGSAAEVDITAGQLSDEPIRVTRLDAPITLPHRYISSTPAPTVTAGSTPLVLDEDYRIDLRTGTLSILSAGTVGSTVAVGDNVDVSYSYDAVTGTHIIGGATPEESFYITGDMEDRNSGEDGYLEVHECRMTVDGDVDWLSEEPLSPVMAGRLLVPPGVNEPYTFTTYKKTD